MALSNAGEMPFLDHLEELRWRLIWSIGAFIVGVAIAFTLLVKVDIILLMQGPIAPFLHGKKLVYTHPGDPFQIVLNFSLALGFILALPVIVWQVWSFLAPALYLHEKKVVVPVLAGGIVLFLAGAALSWFFVLPLALEWLINFQSESLDPMITAGEYFGFVISMTLAFGASFELPIVILLLSMLGIVNPRMLMKFRRHAVVGATIVGAFLTPGDLVWTTILMAVPLYGLYELSIILSWMVYRKKARKAALEAAADEEAPA